MDAQRRSAKELWVLYLEGGIEEVHSHSDSAYRHGTYETIVVKDADGRYWQGFYTLAGDGEEHGWRDGYADDFYEVEPYEVKTTAYRAKTGLGA